MADHAVRYRVRAERPGAHLFDVTLRVSDPDPAGQQLRLPAWIPGSYLIRDFARHVVRLSATAGGRSIDVTRIDKSTWGCAPCEGPLEVSYEVYAFDLSVRGACLDTTRGYFNGPCLLLTACGHEDRPHVLTLERPAGDACATWRVATSMRALSTDDAGYGEYRSDSYDELIDHPVEMSDFSTAQFAVRGVPHEIALTGARHCDLERLCADLMRIGEQHHALFAAAPPIDRYLFLVLAIDKGYGGLEHRWSSSIIIGRDHLPRAGRAEVDKAYRRFLGILSHEYFHLWHVKRTTPAAFTPLDLSCEQHTSLLWVFEGITSYYDDLALVRAGVINARSYLELVAETITGVWQTPGRHKQSLADSSFDAWTKLYQRDANAPNSLISYYTKGALVALALDLLVRRDTDGKCSLDTIMRELWQRYGAIGEGLPERGFEALAAEVSGLDLSAFFDTCIRGTQDPPLAELLGEVGVELAFAPQDPVRPAGVAGLYYLSSLGIRCSARGTLEHVLDGGPAQAAGLSAGDMLVAVDGLRMSPRELAATLKRHDHGKFIEIHVFRRDELLSFRVAPVDAVADVCRLTLAEPVSDEVARRREAWLAPLRPS